MSNNKDFHSQGYFTENTNSIYKVIAQNKEGILQVATVFIALYVLRRSMSASDVVPEVAILCSAL